MSDSKRPIISVALALVVVCAGCRWETSPDQHRHDRQYQVATRGAEVMPFDLDRTVHHFRANDGGGVQEVVVRDTTDIEQIRQVRTHLREMADRFSRGDFSGPAHIHGRNMPGLDSLAAHGGRLIIDYEDTPLGGRIRYVASDTALILALHGWFQAQRTDHGAHAQP